MSRQGSKLLRINENLPVIFIMSPSIALIYMFSLDTINRRGTLPLVDVCRLFSCGGGTNTVWEVFFFLTHGKRLVANS